VKIFEWFKKLYCLDFTYILLILFISLNFSCFNTDDWQTTGSDRTGVTQSNESTEAAVLPKIEGECRCLSLRVLAKQVREILINKKKPTNEILNLGGIGWIEGYVVDEANNDVILFGRHQKGRELLFDDLLIALRNAWGPGPFPYCSLDPTKDGVKRLQQHMRLEVKVDGPEALKKHMENIKKAIGPQQVIIGGGGVSDMACWSGVMIYSDYHMKAVSQGFEKVDGVKSSIDLVLEKMITFIDTGNPMAHSSASMSRYWFHVKKDHPVLLENHGIIYLKHCDVVLLTEKQKAKVDGTLFDSGGDDPVAREFSSAFTKNYHTAAKMYPEYYARLENLYRILSISYAMRLKKVFQTANLDINFFVSQCPLLSPIKLEPELPPLANCIYKRKVYRDKKRVFYYHLAPMVCGGVSMDLGVIAKKIYTNKGSVKQLTQMRKSVIGYRPNTDLLWWIIPDTQIN